LFITTCIEKQCTRPLMLYLELERVGVKRFQRFSQDMTDLHQISSQGLGVNTCSLQSALKNTAPDL